MPQESHINIPQIRGATWYCAFELDFRKADTQNATLQPLPSLPSSIVANQPELRIAA